MINEKRSLIVEKFVSSISEGFSEEIVGSILTREELHEFCKEVENEIYNLFPDREYKSRVFTLNFNLGDKRNLSIRRRILRGEFTPSELASASSENLASEDLQAQRQEWRDKYFTTQVLKVDDNDEPGQNHDSKRPRVVTETKLVQHEPAHSVKIESALPTIELPPLAPPQQSIESPKHAECEKPETESNAQVLQGYAATIKSKLESITHNPLRTSHLAFVDYLVRHIAH